MSGWWPLKYELDCSRILSWFNRHHQKALMCLPIVEKKDSPMIFRLWKEGDELVKRGIFNVLEPKNGQLKAMPEIVLVPLMMFDEKCHRLGYGGGYYDRTIEEMKIKNAPFVTIGLAFDFMNYDK